MSEVKVPLRLLMVEDEEDDAELVSLELEGGGFDVSYTRVETEEGFLLALSEGEFDLIISDYSMPTFNGLRAFALFRQAGLDIPFIFVSGALGEERAVEAMRAGAKDYILKGELGRLCVAVQRELQERRNRERQRELEQHLARAAKLEAVGRLAGGVAHDFNNMLSVVLGHAEIGRGARGVDPDAARHFDQIMEAARRAASLARQLLAYSGRQVLEPMAVVPADILSSVEGLLRPTARENIAIHTATPRTRRVLVDPHQLEQALVNLAVNACDAMPEGGQLFMEVEDTTLSSTEAGLLSVTPGAWVRFRVRDTGSGIDQETLERVFEPFFTTKAPHKGTGLGLASVDGFVRQSGGAIRVTSAVGQGTTFEIWLPVVTAPRSGKHKTGAIRHDMTPTPPPKGSSCILVVEDMELVRDLIQEVLQDSGHQVLVASCGEDALRLSEQHSGRLDLLLTDLLLPGMNGCDLAARVRAKHAHVRIVFMSGYAPEDVKELQAQEVGDAYLPKPIRLETLRTTLHGLLSAPD